MSTSDTRDMTDIIQKVQDAANSAVADRPSLSRRSFFKLAGMGAGGLGIGALMKTKEEGDKRNMR